MSTSPSSRDPILEVRDFNLVFRVDVHRSQSWRETFVNLASSPIKALIDTRDSHQVARNLNLNIYAGERVGILGINGAGKSSFCRCVAGMYAPTSGTIKVHGKVRAIFDTAVGIHPELTGRENADLLVEFLYPRANDKRAIVEEALEFSELGTFVDVPYRHYSKGMQARLCLSVISSRPSDLLILDEVFDGADASFSRKISGRVLDMIRKSGAVIFVSHSFDQLAMVANRLLVYDKGTIHYDGPVEAGIHDYKSLIGY
ncbi:MAG: ABC transporter ATP-binding protein [Deltaproteobacteria bacterium]|nr:ABC transporter ATP-binding protein [Deltaproteobacteria bacterium]